MPSGKKQALLIGNGHFADQRLARLYAPTEDVEALRTVLLDPEIGAFDSVDILVDQPLVPVRRAIAELCAGQSPNDLLLLYYTGHGVLSIDNDFYLALQETTVENPEADGLDADWLRKRMDRCRAKRQVLVLDCCHSGAFMAARKDAGARAVTNETFGEGRYVLTASDAQSFAWDSKALKTGPEGTEGKTSLFTRLLVEGLKTGAAAPDKETISIHDLHTYVRGNLPADAPGMSPQIFIDRGEGDLVLAQNPAAQFRLKDELLQALDSEETYMRLGAVAELETLFTSAEPRLALAARDALQRRLDAETYVPVYKRIEAALDKPQPTVSRPAAHYTERPVSRPGRQTAADKAKKPASPRKPLPEPKNRLFVGVDPSDLPDLAVFKDVDAPWCPEMVIIPAGTFMMGSPPGEKDRVKDEGPQHEVVINQRFALGRHPVTFNEYDQFCELTMREKPGDNGWGRGRRPVINVSWYDAQDNVEWLSEQTGQVYRLPSEAEWEYACRAGTNTRYSFGDEITPKDANFDGNVGKTTVGRSYSPNAWGLHDMHGNVWEWLKDQRHHSYEKAPTDGSAWEDVQRQYSHYHSDYERVVRGGSWNGTSKFLRSAYRSLSSTLGNYDVGFRVARTLD